VSIPRLSPEDQHRWLRLEGHFSAAMKVLTALIESTSLRTDSEAGRDLEQLGAWRDALETIWRTVHARLFPRE
jgi:hypothetical protein